MNPTLENIPGLIGLNLASMGSWAEVFSAIAPADYDIAHSFLKDCGLIVLLKDPKDLRRAPSTLPAHAMLKPKSDDSFCLDYGIMGTNGGGRYVLRRKSTQFAIDRSKGLVVARTRANEPEEAWQYRAMRAYHVQPAGVPITLRIETDGAIHGVNHDSDIPVDVVFVSDDVEGSHYVPVEVDGVKWVADCWGSERDDDAVVSAVVLNNSMREDGEDEQSGH